MAKISEHIKSKTAEEKINSILGLAAELALEGLRGPDTANVERLTNRIRSYNDKDSNRFKFGLKLLSFFPKMNVLPTTDFFNGKHFTSISKVSVQTGQSEALRIQQNIVDYYLTMIPNSQKADILDAKKIGPEHLQKIADTLVIKSSTRPPFLTVTLSNLPERSKVVSNIGFMPKVQDEMRLYKTATSHNDIAVKIKDAAEKGIRQYFADLAKDNKSLDLERVPTTWLDDHNKISSAITIYCGIAT